MSMVNVRWNRSGKEQRMARNYADVLIKMKRVQLVTDDDSDPAVVDPVVTQPPQVGANKNSSEPAVTPPTDTTSTGAVTDTSSVGVPTGEATAPAQADDKGTETATQTGINASEAAVKFAQENGIDLSTVKGSGAEGRITKPDVQAALEARTSK